MTPGGSHLFLRRQTGDGHVGAADRLDLLDVLEAILTEQLWHRDTERESNECSETQNERKRKSSTDPLLVIARCRLTLRLSQDQLPDGETTSDFFMCEEKSV